jgi:hypothetical protein
MNPRRAPVVVALLSALLLSACGADDAASKLSGRWNGSSDATITLKADGTARGDDVGVAWTSKDDRSGSFLVTETNDTGCPTGVTGWEDAATYFISADKLTIENSEGEDLTELTREK